MSPPSSPSFNFLISIKVFGFFFFWRNSQWETHTMKPKQKREPLQRVDERRGSWGSRSRGNRVGWCGKQKPSKAGKHKGHGKRPRTSRLNAGHPDAEMGSSPAGTRMIPCGEPMDKLFSNALISACLQISYLLLWDSTVAHAWDRDQPPKVNDAFSSTYHWKMSGGKLSFHLLEGGKGFWFRSGFEPQFSLAVWFQMHT